MRGERLGPIIDAVGVLRACSETLPFLLDEIDLRLPVHLELLAAVIRSRDGSRWWDCLSAVPSGEVGER